MGNRSWQWQTALPALALLLAASDAAQAESRFDLAAKKGGGNAAEYAWDSAGKVLTVKDGAEITITGAVKNGTRIEVAANATAAITLNGVSIAIPFSGANPCRCTAASSPTPPVGDGVNYSPLRLNAGAKVALNILKTNTLTAGNCAWGKASYCAGIHASSGTTLDIDGTGALTATGGEFGAGIGGSGHRGDRPYNANNDGGAITIRGGTVTAHGGDDSSGIGGSGGGYSWTGAGGTIVISGGTVTAYGGKGRAGIGGSSNDFEDRRNRGDITISGGTVAAYGGSAGGAGIGGSSTHRRFRDDNNNGGAILISGGTVTARGGDSGAGIGGDSLSPGGNITITGDASVTATGGDARAYKSGSGISGGAGIGSGGGDFARSAGIIKIDTTGAVKATGGRSIDSAGAGANIGQGGFSHDSVSQGAGIKSFGNPSPASASAVVGDTVDFSCAISPMDGTPAPTFAWVWQFSDSAAKPPHWTAMSGASGATLTLSSVTAQMAGQYRCVATVTDLLSAPRQGGPGIALVCKETDTGRICRHELWREQIRADDPDSSILYASHPATLTVTAKP